MRGASQQAPGSSITVAWEIRYGLPNVGDQCRIIRCTVITRIDPVSGSRQTYNDIGARNTEDITDRLRWSSSGNEGERAIHFRDFMTSTA